MSGKFVFTPAPQINVPVADSDLLFPVHRIYCVGQNYADHVVEMGGDPDRSDPFFFQKNTDCLLLNNADFPYPSMSSNVHYEIELVVAIGKSGRDISVEDAFDYVYGYAVGIDMTRRDLQADCKKTGRPWEISKAFDHSAPCSAIVPAEQVGDVSSGTIWLSVNDEMRQKGDLNQMIWKVNETISYLSKLFELKAGDLIFTGTPAGVGAVNRGDVMKGGIDRIGTITAKVV